MVIISCASTLEKLFLQAITRVFSGVLKTRSVPQSHTAKAFLLPCNINPVGLIYPVYADSDKISFKVAQVLRIKAYKSHLAGDPALFSLDKEHVQSSDIFR